MTDPLLRRSRFLFEFDAASCLDAPSQSLDARTGHPAVFSRAAVTPAVDAAGNTRTYGPSQPSFEWADVNGDGILEALLRLGTSDRLYHGYNGLPAARAYYLAMVDHIIIGQADGTRLWEIGNSAVATGYLSLQRSATGYTAAHNNVSATVTATVAPTAIGPDFYVELLLQVASNGALTLSAAVNGGTEVVGTPTGANALAQVWNQPRLSIGSDYSGSNRASQGIRRFREYPGTATLALMRTG